MQAKKFGSDEVQNDNGREGSDMRGPRSIVEEYSRTILSDKHEVPITGTTYKRSDYK